MNLFTLVAKKMRVECPCGELIKDVGDPSASFADLLPSQCMDDYCSAIEKAVHQHSEDPDVASQWVVHDTVPFFRQMCQCPRCGRVFIEDENHRTHEFVPAAANVPRDLLSRRDAR